MRPAATAMPRSPHRAPVLLATALLFVTAFAGIAPELAHAGAPGPDWEAPIREESVRGDPPAPNPTLPTANETTGSTVDETRANATTTTPSMATPPPPPAPRPMPAPRPVLDPSARLLGGDDASEAWMLYIELDDGRRITQRFLLSNAGPGEHSAVAAGHLAEPGRAPYQYVNGRTRARWTLSDDRLFFDIAASHLDLHRPKGELRISKDDIEIQLFFDFGGRDPSAAVPKESLPANYQVEVLAVGANTRGTLRAPWMTTPVEVTGRTWLVHSWTNDEEARLLARRIDLFGRDSQTSFYGIHLKGRGDWQSGWTLTAGRDGRIIESGINDSAQWKALPGRSGPSDYPTPRGFEMSGGPVSGRISLETEWLRFDPLEVLPQPFQWFVRRRSKPQEVWADARIGVSISTTSDPPSLPNADETTSAMTGEATRFPSRSNRETEDESLDRTVTGVASITFLNPE